MHIGNVRNIKTKKKESVAVVCKFGGVGLKQKSQIKAERKEKEKKSQTKTDKTSQKRCTDTVILKKKKNSLENRKVKTYTKSKLEQKNQTYRIIRLKSQTITEKSE